MELLLVLADRLLFLKIISIPVTLYYWRRRQWLHPVKGQALLRRYGPDYMNELTELITPILIAREQAEYTVNKIREMLGIKKK